VDEDEGGSNTFTAYDSNPESTPACTCTHTLLVSKDVMNTTIVVTSYKLRTIYKEISFN